MADPADVLDARRRLALRAERAFGLTITRRPTRGTGVSPVQAADEARPSPGSPTVPKAHSPTLDDRRQQGRDAPATSQPAAPTTDLFGNIVKPDEQGSATAGPDFADPPPPRNKRIELLQALDENEVTGCTKCDLHENRTHTVFGEGDPEARLAFIGEGPGENEDLSGRPFVGKAGGLLDKMIAGMGLKREDVYIANVVKCRPPGNRTPTAGEVATCTPYLDRQLELIRPSVIVTLGLPATRHLLGLKLSMGKMRGQWHDWRGIRVMPTYHPAYLLRSYTEANRRAVWDDLRLVMEALGLPEPRRRGG